MQYNKHNPVCCIKRAAFTAAIVHLFGCNGGVLFSGIGKDSDTPHQDTATTAPLPTDDSEHGWTSSDKPTDDRPSDRESDSHHDDTQPTDTASDTEPLCMRGCFPEAVCIPGTITAQSCPNNSKCCDRRPDCNETPYLYADCIPRGSTECRSGLIRNDRLCLNAQEICCDKYPQYSLPPCEVDFVQENICLADTYMCTQNGKGTPHAATCPSGFCCFRDPDF